MTPHAKQAALQGAFRALADPTRRDILMFLREQDMTIGEVVEHFDVTRGAIKKHLVVLEEGGLISVHPRGRERVNRLEPDGLKSIDAWLGYFHRFWDQKLSNLKKAAEKAERSHSKKRNT